MATKAPRLMFKKISKKKDKKEKGLVDLSKRLYLRLPRIIKEALDVQDIHPLIKKVIIPRQRGRFCFLEFENVEDTETALADLADFEFPDGRRIFISKATTKKAKEGEQIGFRIQRTGRTNMNVDKLPNTTAGVTVSSDDEKDITTVSDNESS